MLRGSIWDKLVMFSLPLAATGILQQLFNAADVAVVASSWATRPRPPWAATGPSSPCW